MQFVDVKTDGTVSKLYRVFRFPGCYEVLAEVCKDVFRQMEVRHKQRQASIDFAYAKQNSTLKESLL
jgi:hypothetical protein